MTQKAPMSKPVTADEIRVQHESNGARRANTNLIMYALEQLKPGDDRSNAEKLAAMVLERDQAVAGLRRLAEQYGPVEWPESLSLPDIIDKTLSVLLTKTSPEKSKR